MRDPENLAHLVDQLRGKVVLKVDDGAGPLNGSDFFERMFPTSRLAMKAADEIERLRGAILAIRQATIEGRVCDDVAWFSQIETLHDYCEGVLSPDRTLELNL